MREEEEEEEEEEEFSTFHDSLDRLVSSSNSSCSSSENENEFDLNFHNNYDVWVSQPTSVQERRVSLLREMGLSKDPTLLRRPNDITCCRYCNTTNYKNNTNISHHHFYNSSCNDDNVSTSCCCCNGVDVNTDFTRIRNCQFSRSKNELLSSISSSSNVSPNKPPKVKVRENCSTFTPSIDDDDDECNGNGSENVNENGNAVCMIKNLDNGKEFVVNELENIKEVGTGRQLTMEEFSFEICAGTSPIVQELMRRQNVEDMYRKSLETSNDGSNVSGSKHKKRPSWLKGLKNVANSVTGSRERRSSDDRDTSSERGGRRSSSATDDSQDVSFHGPERVRVRQYGKSVKELTALYKSQEVQGHNGSIWSIKFSLDGKYLASAGEDCVIHVWQVVESERKGDYFLDRSDDGNFSLLFLANGSPEAFSMYPKLDGHLEKKRRGRSSISRKSVSLEQILVPEAVFALSDKPMCSLQGHLDDVLDLSWSKSQQLLSSSMDKTVRLWDLSSKACLKIFSHSDYVTCIQFNPLDDRYFISGSLDAKVRIWSIPDRQVVDWNDLHEMVTAACYTPDGQGALVGSYKGSCLLYNTSDNKLQQKCQINLQNKKKKTHQKKITGFQFAPGSSTEVLITSADSRVRVVDGVDLVHKFKGFRNANSQISASLTSNGKYVISASEDSYVYIWRHENETRPNRTKGITTTRSYEFFHCQDVSMAIPWPGISDSLTRQNGSARGQYGLLTQFQDILTANHPPTPAEEINGSESALIGSPFNNSPINGTLSSAANSYLFDRISVTWPEEKFVLAAKRHSPRVSVDSSNGFQNRSGWGMVIVTAGLKGEIRTFLNFGLPVRI